MIVSGINQVIESGKKQNNSKIVMMLVIKKVSKTAKSLSFQGQYRTTSARSYDIDNCREVQYL